MAFTLDDVRHALRTARERRFAEVELVGEDTLFLARLQPGGPPPSPAESSAPAESPVQEVRATVVGYLREALKPVAVGDRVEAGQVVASIEALGILNDVEAKEGGEVLEWVAEIGEPVQYGQPLLRTRA